MTRIPSAAALASALLPIICLAQAPATSTGTPASGPGAIKEAQDRTSAVRNNLDRLRKENERRAANSSITEKDRAAVESLLKEVDSNSLSDSQKQSRIDDFLKTAQPEVKEMFLQQKSATPATGGTTKPPAKPAGPISFSNVPVPPPKPRPQGLKKKEPEGMAIDSDALFFHQNDKVAIFKGNVRLRSAAMNIDCDELEVIFKEAALKEDGPKNTSPPPPPPPGAKPTPGTVPAAPAFDPLKPNVADAESEPEPGEKPPQKQDKIEKAWARGNGSLVTIVRHAAGETTICKCGEAIFDDKSGNLTLKIWPSVEKGGRKLEATDRNTVIIVDKNNRLETHGAVKTLITGDTRAPAEPTPPVAPQKTPASPTTPRTGAAAATTRRN